MVHSFVRGVIQKSFFSIERFFFVYTILKVVEKVRLYIGKELFLRIRQVYVTNKSKAKRYKPNCNVKT